MIIVKWEKEDDLYDSRFCGVRIFYHIDLLSYSQQKISVGSFVGGEFQFLFI